MSVIVQMGISKIEIHFVYYTQGRMLLKGVKSNIVLLIFYVITVYSMVKLYLTITWQLSVKKFQMTLEI